MLGLSKKDLSADKLTVQVHVTVGREVFGLAFKIWAENARTVQLDRQTGKEFLHFGYANPRCVVWLQRDRGREDLFELIVRWENSKLHEVYVISNGGAQPVGDDSRAKAILNSMMITPSIVPAGGSRNNS
jgi:hypothetical protein